MNYLEALIIFAQHKTRISIMKISYSWLKEYLDITVDSQELSVLLTDCGLEVEGIEYFDSIRGGLKGLVIGEVKSKEKHPNANKLSIALVDIGESAPLTIVCGAPNLEVGQKVVVAKPGTTICPVEGNGFKIKSTKIRGSNSEGMICAEDEIGLGTEHNGIIVLEQDAPIGTLASDYFKVIEDVVFDIGLTPNRTDAASHIGVARDLIAIFTNLGEKKSLKRPSVEGFKKDNNKLPIIVEVEDSKACPRYSGLTISGVSVKESPQWLQNRLKAIGQSPINNIVDITNFVLFETGQPLHAFDVQEISGKKVIIKKLKEGTNFKTLDDQERKLSKDDLMICNDFEGMCIAGVFGGIKSGVTDKTTDIFLESAYFDPTTIRRTAKRHELNTNASFRFERGADPNNTIYALKRASMLIKELCGGSISSEIVDIYPEHIKDFKIKLNYANCDQLIGQRLKRKVIKQILTSLEMHIEDESETGLVISVPPYRADVQRETDLIEEILRIYGYNNIEMEESTRFTFSTASQYRKNVKELVSNLLCDTGLTEIMNNSISRSSYYDNDEGLVKVMNPLNADLDTLRKTLLYGGLEVIARNQNHQNPDIKLFEFGKTYFSKGEEGFGEHQQLAIFVSGRKNQEQWNSVKENADYFYLKGIVQKVISKLGIDTPGITKVAVQTDHFTGQSYEILKRKIVKIVEVNCSLLNKFDINSKVFYAIINWDNIENLLKMSKIKYKDLNKYPAVRRDLALLIDSNIQYSEIEKLAWNTEKSILKRMNLFDVYEGEKIGKGKKSYAVSFILQDVGKTLTDAEVDKVMNELISVYKKELGAEIR